MDNCIFCSIINKEIPSVTVYESDIIMAIEDIKPEAPVHVLVFPKVHIESINSLDEKNIGIVDDMMLTVKKIAELKGISEKGYRVISNVGEYGGQSIKHLHFHVIGGKKLGLGLIGSQ